MRSLAPTPVKTIALLAAMNAEDGADWRARVGERDNAGRSLDLSRAREKGRGRDADTPEQISVLGWWDILWRVLWSISEDRVLATSGSVAFFALLAVLPGVTAIVSLYGLFADASTVGNHLTILAGILPRGVQASSRTRSSSSPDSQTRLWERPSRLRCSSPW